MFGGACFDQLTGRHILVDGHLWIFDFEKLEWSMLPSLTMLQSTYFHAASMNEVIIFLLVKITLFFLNLILYSEVKYGHMEVLYMNQHQNLMKHV
jgi:hypothetical protein